MVGVESVFLGRNVRVEAFEEGVSVERRNSKVFKAEGTTSKAPVCKHGSRETVVKMR